MILTWALSLLQLVVSVTPVLTSTDAVNGTPATTGVVVIEIPDGQIQNPTPTKSGTSFFRGTDVAGQVIFYVGSIGQNALGATTTDLFGIVRSITTTNSAGSTITDLAESSATQGGIVSTIALSDIPTLSSTPPSFAFTTVNANNRSVVDIGQLLTGKDGSTSTAVILSGISTSCRTTVNSRGSTVSETFGIFTASNGSVVTNTLSFAMDSTSLSLFMSVTGTSFSISSPTSSYQFSATGASDASSDSSAVPSNLVARANTTGITAATSADSSSSGSISHRDSKNTGVPILSGTRSPSSINTLGSTVVAANFTSMSSSSPSPSTYAAFPTTTIQSTLFTRQPTARDISPNASAQSTLSRFHFPSGSAHTVSLLTPEETTTTAGKGSMPLAGQAPLSTSTMTGSNTTNNTAGGGLYLVAQTDAPLAKSLASALLGQQEATISTIPPGMIVQSIVTKTKCSHAFAMATTKVSGSTVTTVVPKLCHDDAAFLLLPGPSAIRLLCTKKFSLFGCLLRWICDPKTGTVIGVDDITPPGPPSGGGPPGGSGTDPNDDPESEDDEPTQSRDVSDRASSTTIPSTNVPSTSVSSTHVSSTRILSSRLSSTSFSSTSRPFSSRLSSTMKSSASSAVASPYYIFGGVGNDNQVSDLLGEQDPGYKALPPDIGSTPESGADWVNVNLTSYEVAKMSASKYVLLVAPYISLTESDSLNGSDVSASASFSTLSSYPSTTLSTPSTFTASSTLSRQSGVSNSKFRRHLPSEQFREKDFFSQKYNDTESILLTKRDPGSEVVAQYAGLEKQPCPRDLAVISWGPRAPTVSNYPYIYQQSKGENTWVFLVSTGIEEGHVVSRTVFIPKCMCEE